MKLEDLYKQADELLELDKKRTQGRVVNDSYNGAILIYPDGLEDPVKAMIVGTRENRDYFAGAPKAAATIRELKEKLVLARKGLKRCTSTEDDRLSDYMRELAQQTLNQIEE